MPYPIMTVPGSIPRIILEDVCNRKIIFDADHPDVEQKYQNIRQLHPGPGCLFGADLVYQAANPSSTRLAELTRSDRDCGQRPRLVEAMARPSAHAGQLGH